MKTDLTLILTAAVLCPFAATPAFAQGDDGITMSAANTSIQTGAVAFSSAAVPNDINVASDSSETEINGEAAQPSYDLAYEPAYAGLVNTAGVSPDSVVLNLSASDSANILSSAAAAAAAPAAQGGGTGGREDSFTVLLNQDSFFGFYPSFNGLIPISENVDFSFYGILWTNAGFSSTAFGPAGIASDNDLWTEFGVGANFHVADGKLQIKPQIGLTNGALLSSGFQDGNDVPTGTGGNFADGIVPSLTMNYSDDSFEAEFYGGYYAALRNRNNDFALDFLHTWVNAGAKIGDNFSAGAHYELLSNTRNSAPGVGGAVVYQWLGPYVQFATSNGFFARFTAGADIESGNDGDFYKLTAGFSF